MQNHHRIALLSAGLLVGAQIAIASIGTGATTDEAGNQVEPAPDDHRTTAGGASPEFIDARGEVAAAPDENAQSSVTALEPNLPVSARQNPVPQGTAFPAQDDESRMLPALVEYLDRTEHLRVTGASGNVFPPSTDDQPMLPALAAYLEGRDVALREEQRLAAEAQQPVAAGVAADAAQDAQGEPGSPAAMQEPAREVSFLDRILPTGLRNLF